MVTEPFPHQGYTAPFGKDLPVTIPALILLGLAAVVPADAPRLMPAVVEVPSTHQRRRQQGAAMAAIELEIGGVRVRIGDGATASIVSAVIRVLKAIS